MSKIEIPLSKTKLLLSIGGSILFVVLGFFLLTTIAGKQTGYVPSLMKSFGMAAILFFGLIGIYGIKKLFDKNVGLIIDDNGITDNTSALSIGLIKWADITEIKTERVMSTKFLLIFTNDPEKYLEKVSGVNRKLMKANMKMYGTPVSITSSTLKYDFRELEKLIQNKLNAYRNSVSNGA